MPAIGTHQAPAIARAVARPAAGGMRRSRSPWITTVGARTAASRRVRSPSASSATSWRAAPTRDGPRRHDAAAISRSAGSSRGRVPPMIRKVRTTPSTYAA
ncbi:MAG: hypothetical protein R2939_18405 [Kofleriaceae bacterium]